MLWAIALEKPKGKDVKHSNANTTSINSLIKECIIKFSADDKELL